MTIGAFEGIPKDQGWKTGQASTRHARKMPQLAHGILIYCLMHQTFPREHESGLSVRDPNLWQGNSRRRSFVDIRSVRQPTLKPGALYTRGSPTFDSL